MKQAQAQQNRVVVVSEPGVMREALVALLASFPTISIAGCVSGGLLALNLIRQQPPHLLVIDNNLPEEEAAALLRQVKREWPQVGCLILGSSARQRPQWLAAGADEMLPRYGSTQELEAALRRLAQIVI